MRPLHVAFIWHMHQPFYRDLLTGTYTLPWVRLHATKDYLHLGEILARHPTVHQTFNFVPSLIEQLVEYGNGAALDEQLRLSLLSRWSAEDKRRLLADFFAINADRFVHRYPRYTRLLELRNTLAREGEHTVGEGEDHDDDFDLLSRTYWRDLVAWFNLAWIDPGHLSRDPDLKRLVEKGKGFTRDDLNLIVDKHRSACAAVVPLYRRLAASGQVELTTTPFYHPILPLLIDTAAGRAASPGLPLPPVRFAQPDDAREHIRRAVAYHTSIFGDAPAGLWPAEGAVSQEAAQLIGDFPNFRWLATDEHLLARSLATSFARDGFGSLYDPRPLYQPYRIANTELAVVFRDQVLSDRIGFVYQHWDSFAAAGDLVQRLEQMANLVAGDPEPYLATIILDGENCWEFYPNNGEDFLNHLFTLLAGNPRLQTVSVGEYLAAHPPRRALRTLATGSWIGANLETWIGEPEQNRAWELLALTRSRVAAWRGRRPAPDSAAIERVMRAMYVAEGSDWFWWYYSRNRFGGEKTFDALFRRHLGAIYRLMGEVVPAWIDQPLVGPGPDVPRQRGITGYVSPSLAAGASALPEWERAGYVDAGSSTGAMQRGTTMVRRVYYGYNAEAIFIRLEGEGDLGQQQVELAVATPCQAAGHPLPHPGQPGETARRHDFRFGWRLVAEPVGMDGLKRCQAAAEGGWRMRSAAGAVARDQHAVELRVPLADLEVGFGDTIYFVVTVGHEGNVESIPEVGAIGLSLVPQN
ncbi:MAG: hypothetical protein HYY04_08150 [Chloroflexi bacterium]|nr:hypothetical protein [Chloroflexota bacterium]